ncbi:proline-tRNA ligase (DUF1680) [Citrus sinensis]|uniref:Proline-tRNA ligase (DUF1680) n=1 Tax=Citrus sinensis TaxID=2711 RepID=A0ACB8MWR1_CITSI|nr:proline-tRNA ligase (DUF1680) [Citrus sinensis]
MLSSYQLRSPANEGPEASKFQAAEEKFDNKMLRNTNATGDFKLPGDFLKEVSLHDVRLLPNSMHWRAQQTNLEYLVMLDVDRLVWSFRKTAGLPTPGTPYGGWEDQKMELRGHFLGHYLSATAMAWASTRNETVKQKMDAVMSVLSECQKKIGTGYLSAFPRLLDQYTLANNGQALNITIWMADYFNTRVQNLIARSSLERHYQTLNDESGGMNDALYKLYGITKDPKHLKLAELFDKPCFLGLLAVKEDNIAGLHANTHIPLVCGVQNRYELTGDEQSMALPFFFWASFKKVLQAQFMFGNCQAMGTFFMDIINSSHSYATGGTSHQEFWTDPKRIATALSAETEESCTTYNMLKVSRYLFKWTKQVTYADYYERALTNGVLGIQRGTEPGVMIYMLPLSPGSSKAKSYHGWGDAFDSFWCCYGTGIESFAKLGDSIYFEQEGKGPGVYIIQYISSTFDWKAGQIVIHQNVDPVVSWDQNLRMALTFTSNKGPGVSSVLNLRIPFWANPNGGKATLNKDNLQIPSPDDRPQYASLQAIFYGPYLLAGYSQHDHEIKTGPVKSLSEWITPIPASYNAGLVTFSQKSGNSSLVLMKNQSVTIEPWPAAGTGGDANATFRLIGNDQRPINFTTVKNVISKQVMFEPFDFPGKLLMQQGNNDSLVIANNPGNSVFQVNAGLDGKPDTVSLESVSRKGCFVFSDVNLKAGAALKLNCQQPDDGFKQAASFVMQKGISQYHPISFLAKGSNRNYLLAPLLSFRDESYSVYFNITN